MIWRRGGTTPEMPRAAFDYSTHGQDWVHLGEGTRVEGGWRLAGLAGLSSGMIRARGDVGSGLVESHAESPRIEVDPVSLTNVMRGATVSFRVVGQGSAPLGYQWYRNGVALEDGDRIDGAHTGTLTLKGVTGADAGLFSAVVSNDHGSVTSTAATMSVSDPFIWSHPQGLVLDYGEITSLSVTAVGSAPLHFHWFREGVLHTHFETVGGTQYSRLHLGNLSQTNAGNYTVVVSNAFGAVTSGVARVGVRDPAIKKHPVSRAVNRGDYASVEVIARGTEVACQWFKDGVALSPNLGSAIWLSDFQPPDAGDYWVVVTGRHGSVTSQVASITVNLARPDLEFAPNLDGTVNTMALQTDGAILLGGSHTVSPLNYAGRIARFRSDGTRDESFLPDADRPVRSLAVQADGKIVVAGEFTNLCAQPQKYLGRLNPDGTLDASFAPEADQAVRALALAADGKIVVGGEFSNLGGQAQRFVGRLNADGTTDRDFRPTLDQEVYALALQGDGKVLVGGSFATVDGKPRLGLARLNADGTLDEGFVPEAAAPLYSIALQADGKIVVGGQFYRYELNGNPHHNLMRLNPDGTLDKGFIASSFGAVSTVVLQTDGKILVGGQFESLGTVRRSRIARLNPDGTVDDGFNPGANGAVNALALQPDGRILIGGGFSSLAGVPQSYLGRLHPTDPVVASLVREESRLTWARSGSGPELWRATFAHSADGQTWTDLGVAARIVGGWQLSVPSPPIGGTIRARGHVTGGGASGAAWSIESFAGVPIVVSQPASLTRPATSTANFRVSAVGTEPFQYQWRKDGIPIADGAKVSGAQASTLAISDLRKTDEGGYSAVVSNVDGTAISASATLAVTEPVIVSQPAHQSGELGESAVLHVTAVGTDLSFEWRKEGVPLPGGTNASLTLTDLRDSDAGDYTVVVTNRHGSVTSTVATVAVNLAVVDPGFLPNLGADPAEVSVMAVQADGAIVLGGYFPLPGRESRTDLHRVSAGGGADASFKPEVDGSVYALAVQRDGRILVGGRFSSLCGQARESIGRLHADGTIDLGFNPGANKEVVAIAEQADGRILVAGYFTALGGTTRDYLGRLLADGSLDPDFNSAPNAPVFTVVVQPDGKILVGGYFTGIDGKPRPGIARLHSSGSVDESFNPGSGGWGVQSIALQADGKILFGNVLFASSGGSRPRGVERLNADGTWDMDFDPRADNTVYSLAVQSDGRILIGGTFAQVAGQSRDRLARLNPDGTLDQEFRPGMDGELKAVRQLAVQPDGAVLVGGRFTVVGGSDRIALARLRNTVPATQSLTRAGPTITWLRGGGSPEVVTVDFEHSPDGVSWSSVGAGARIPGGWTLTTPSLPEGGNIRAWGQVAGGNTTWFVVSRTGAPAILSPPSDTRANAGTTVALTVGAGGTPPLEYQWYRDGVAIEDGERIAGARTATLSLADLTRIDEGTFQVVIRGSGESVTSAPAILLVNDPAISLQPVSQNREPGESALLSVRAGATALTYQWWKDGEPIAGALANPLVLTNLQDADAGRYTVVVGGQFGSVTSSVAFLTVNRAVQDPEFQAQTWVEPFADVPSLALQADGKILVGGNFTSLAGQPRNHLARLNVNGTLDSSFNPGAGGAVKAIAIQDDGRIVVGGRFSVLGGWPRSNIGRLNVDRTLDLGFNPGANERVEALAVQEDGSLVVGGQFSSFGGQPRQGIARIGPDGVLDASFHPEVKNGSVLALAIQSDGGVLLGGYFSAVNGVKRMGVARLHSDGSLDTGFTSDITGTVEAVLVQADGKILVGGSITDGFKAGGLARLHADGTADRSIPIGVAPGSLWSMGLHGDGRIVLAGRFTHAAGVARGGVARLNPDGTLDLRFNPQSVLSHTTPKSVALALAPDGKIVLGGEVRTENGLFPKGVIRLSDSSPATEHWSYDGSTLIWRRGGTSPETAHTGFEASLDGTDWIRLGQGSRIPGGWQLTNVTVPPSSKIRGWGRVSAGNYFVESHFEIPSGAPRIVSPPKNLKATAGQGGTFEVEVVGEMPMSYQWLFEAVPIPGATNSTLALHGIASNHMGDYAVVASNSHGSVTSAPVSLEVMVVNTAPRFVRGPDSSIREDAGAQRIPSWATQISAGGPHESGQGLAFETVTDRPELFAASPAIEIDGTLTYTPAAEAYGTAEVTVVLRDDGGSENGGQDRSEPDRFLIVVRPVNDPPQFVKGPDQNLRGNAGPQVVLGWARQISAGPANEARQALTFEVTPEHPELFLVPPVLSPAGALSYTPAANVRGKSAVRVILRDDGGTSEGGLDVSLPQTFVIEWEAEAPRLGAELTAEGVRLTWTGEARLESAESIAGPWQARPEALSPFRVAPAGAEGYFRLVPQTGSTP